MRLVSPSEGWSILIRAVSCSADVYWAAVCIVLCRYWFGNGVLCCSTCHHLIWRDPGISLGVGPSNDRQLLITDQQWDTNSSVSDKTKQNKQTKIQFHREELTLKFVALSRPLKLFFSPLFSLFIICFWQIQLSLYFSPQYTRCLVTLTSMMAKLYTESSQVNETVVWSIRPQWWNISARSVPLRLDQINLWCWPKADFEQCWPEAILDSLWTWGTENKQLRSEQISNYVWHSFCIFSLMDNRVYFHSPVIHSTV